MGHIWFQGPFFRSAAFPVVLYFVLIGAGAAIVASLLELLGIWGK